MTRNGMKYDREGVRIHAPVAGSGGPAWTEAEWQIGEHKIGRGIVAGAWFEGSRWAWSINDQPALWSSVLLILKAHNAKLAGPDARGAA
jgi:hypothetical protein